MLFIQTLCGTCLFFIGHLVLDRMIKVSKNQFSTLFVWNTVDRRGRHLTSVGLAHTRPNYDLGVS